MLQKYEYDYHITEMVNVIYKIIHMISSFVYNFWGELLVYLLKHSKLSIFFPSKHFFIIFLFIHFKSE